jgi:hypothetical protein
VAIIPQCLAGKVSAVLVSSPDLRAYTFSAKDDIELGVRRWFLQRNFPLAAGQSSSAVGETLLSDRTDKDIL